MSYIKKTEEQKRINKMNEIIEAHGNIYLFDKFKYVPANNLCTLVCKLCGEEIQTNISSIKHKLNTCCKSCNLKLGMFKKKSLELTLDIKIEYQSFTKLPYDVTLHAKTITQIGDKIANHLSSYNNEYKLLFRDTYFKSISDIFKNNELEYLNNKIIN